MKAIATFSVLLLIAACANTECGAKGYNWGYTFGMIGSGNPYQAHAAALYMQEVGDNYCAGATDEQR